jgi:hypothetical protein
MEYSRISRTQQCGRCSCAPELICEMTFRNMYVTVRCPSRTRNTLFLTATLDEPVRLKGYSHAAGWCIDMVTAAHRHAMFLRRPGTILDTPDPAAGLIIRLVGLRLRFGLSWGRSRKPSFRRKCLMAPAILAQVQPMMQVLKFVYAW